MDRFITVYGEMTKHRIITKDKTYWLSYSSKIQCKGFFLIEKTWRNLYNVLRILEIDYDDDSDENSGD